LKQGVERLSQVAYPRNAFVLSKEQQEKKEAQACVFGLGGLGTAP